MENLRDMLAAKAARVIPGQDYNAYRGEVGSAGTRSVATFHFEDFLPAVAPENALVDRIVPSLARFIHRKRLDLSNPRQVEVALFFGETCFILPAEAVLDLYCDIEHTTRQGLGLRALGWLA